MRGAGSSRAQIASIEIDRRARRIGRDVQDDHVRLDLGERTHHPRLGLFVRLPFEGLGVVAIRLGILLQLLVRASDVEADVAIGRETIGREKVLQSAAEILLGVARGTQLELEIRFVGHVLCERCRLEGGFQDGERCERECETDEEGSHGRTKGRLFSG